MTKREYRVGDKVVMNSNYSTRSKYFKYAGMRGRITYVNYRSGSYDIKLDGTEDTRLEYVDPKMFCSADDLKTPEQKREVVEKNLIARRKDAEKVIEEKKAIIVDIHNRLLYLKDNPAATEIDETAYTAWKIASVVQEEIDSLTTSFAAGAKPLEKGEFKNLVSGLVYNILKTTNK